MAAKIRQDALAAMVAQGSGGHLDAAEANVFARELLKVRTKVFEIAFPELKALRLVPRNTELNNTDEEYTYRTATEYGQTKLASSYTGTAPRADVSMVEATPKRIRPIRASYGYDIQEARIAARTGNQLPMRKANAARRAIAQQLNKVLTFGAAATVYGVAMEGLANVSSPLTFTPANSISSGSKSWLTKTPDEILADMHGIVRGIVTNSNDVEHPNTLLLPLARYELVATTRIGDGVDKTILQQFLGTNPHVKQVEAWYALDAAPASEWTGMRMMAYDKHPEVLEALVPVEFEQFAPQMVGLETITECQCRMGGIVVYRPKAISYGDQI